ncbi:hypothetical protein GCM10010974_33640 [Brevibacterium sediminis]|uniref:Glycosyltransferase family 2 protein n=1 Tax=Brevibacterium sediminis TaxID=1857024 RepID=A0ABQ1MX27_9MICO|nr:hypothetical protein [Brevibacterium sediminis]GGC48689.1 hypothetical protein GCM10010974_33640 [Brevibacterium sediminis]
MTVISLTFVRGGSDVLESSVRNNLEYVDGAYYVLGQGANEADRVLRQIALEGLPVSLVDHSEESNLRTSFDTAVRSIEERWGGTATVIILETDDFLTAPLPALNTEPPEEGVFSLPRHIAYAPTSASDDWAPATTTSIRKEAAPSSFALGFHLHRPPGRIPLVDDRFTGRPTFCGTARSSIDGCAIIRIPVRNAEQFLVDITVAWLGVEARSGVKSAVPSTAGTWLSNARELVIANGAGLTDERLWSWQEEQLAPTVIEALRTPTTSASSHRNAILAAAPRLLTDAVTALDDARTARDDTRWALHRERLMRLHDTLCTLLEDQTWHKTWVWKDQAAVLELFWGELPVAFDVFITSDEISIQLVSRKKSPIPDIAKYLSNFGFNEVKLPGKPGRYVLSAIPIHSSTVTLQHVRQVADIIRPLASGMSK